MKKDVNFTIVKQVKPPISEYARKWQEAGLEDAQLKVGNNRDISNSQKFSMYINSTAWAVWDATPRDITLIGFNHDRTKTYSWTLVATKGSITAELTKEYTINTPSNNVIAIPSGKAVRISVSPSTATQTITVSVTGTFKYLKGSTLSLTSTTNEAIIMATTGNQLLLKLQYSTSAGERPIFWILIEII